MRTRIKICGMMHKQDLDCAISSGVDSLGFIFYKKSKRYISTDQASILLKNVTPFVGIVGVFVNPSFEEIKDACSKIPLTLLQFHGDEPHDYCQFCSDEMHIPWIKAIRVGKNTTQKEIFTLAKKYDKANGLLFDTDSVNFGGVGASFDWERLPTDPSYPVILAGGINSFNVIHAINKVQPYAIDVCSGVEIEKQPGVKDHLKIIQLVKQVRLADKNNLKI